MHKYYLPAGMRYSTLKERKEFYKKEFNFNNISDWFGRRRNLLETVYAIIVGRHTKIFKKEFKSIYKNTMLIDDYVDLDDIKDYFIYYLPEGVYYDRNLYSKRCSSCSLDYYNCWNCKHFIGQELAFDIDPENIECPIHGDIEKKMKEHQGLGFCEIEFNKIKEWTQLLIDELSNKFDKLKIVYSGRGFHIHVFDEKAIRMKKSERRRLSSSLLKKGYPIDEWVTNGNMRLIRLPYSLHGMVSRKVIPLTKKEIDRFDPVNDKRARPKFLKD